MKTDLFQSCGHCWVFQICWQTECSTFTASSFRIWNSSTRIPSPPLALFIVMLSKAHLTSHSRMSGSMWVITPLWLSGVVLSWLSWRSFLYSSFVYSCHLFFISSASVRCIPFLSFVVLIFAWSFPLVSLLQSLDHCLSCRRYSKENTQSCWMRWRKIQRKEMRTRRKNVGRITRNRLLSAVRQSWKAQIFKKKSRKGLYTGIMHCREV